MKWTCEKCSAINPQFSYRCHNCRHDLDGLTCATQHHEEIRGTGRSTVIALRLIAQAIENPGKWFKVEDHYYKDQIRANEHLMTLIEDIVKKNSWSFDYKRELRKTLSIKSKHFGFNVVNGIMTGKVKPKFTLGND